MTPSNSSAPAQTDWWKISVSGYGDFSFLGTEEQAEEVRRNKSRWEQGVGKKVRITAEEAAELP